ncbi:MAG: hypothetical protein ACRD3W_21225, partial [Terriglobales bacterium]
APDLPGDIEYLDCHRSGPGRGHAMVGDALVEGLNQMRAGVRQLETEVTAGIGLTIGNFLHPLPQRDQRYAVSGGRFTRGAVAYLASKGLSEERSGGCEEYKNNSNKEARPSRVDG